MNFCGDMVILQNPQSFSFFGHGTHEKRARFFSMTNVIASENEPKMPRRKDFIAEGEGEGFRHSSCLF